MKAEAWEKYVIFNGEVNVVPKEELLGRPTDYARCALMHYQERHFVRAIFWAVMASAASSFEAAYVQVEKK